MKKKATVAAILVITVLSLCGCRAFVEHKRTYKHAVGTWDLNSIYVNTVSVAAPTLKLELRDDNTASITTYTQQPLTQEQQQAVDNGQEVTPDTNSTTVNYTVTSENDTITLTSEDGQSTTYTFSVDTQAKDLHMNTNIGEDHYHYVYYLVEE